jgi:hypothetical protein
MKFSPSFPPQTSTLPFRVASFPPANALLKFQDTVLLHRNNNVSNMYMLFSASEGNRRNKIASFTMRQGSNLDKWIYFKIGLTLCAAHEDKEAVVNCCQIRLSFTRGRSRN